MHFNPLRLTIFLVINSFLITTLNPHYDNIKRFLFFSFYDLGILFFLFYYLFFYLLISDLPTYLATALILLHTHTHARAHTRTHTHTHTHTSMCMHIHIRYVYTHLNSYRDDRTYMSMHYCTYICSPRCRRDYCTTFLSEVFVKIN